MTLVLRPEACILGSYAIESEAESEPTDPQGRKRADLETRERLGATLSDIRRFIDEACVPGGHTRSSVLYDAYRAWRSESGAALEAPALSERSFYEALANAGYPSRKSGGYMVRDLSLAVDADELPDGVKAQAVYYGDKPGAQGPAYTRKPGRPQPCNAVNPDASCGCPDEYCDGRGYDASDDQLAKAYSSLGQGMTRREVAEAFGIPEETVTAMLKNAGIRKSDPPVSPARLAAADDLDDLVDEGIAARRHAYKVKLQRAYVRDLEKRAETAEANLTRLRSDRETLASWCGNAVQRIAPARDIKPDFNAAEGWAAFVPIADPHVGLQVYGKESWTGENYHTDLAADRIIDAAVRAANWIKGMSNVLGAPRVIHYGVLGDLFHALHYATVSGRPMQVDGRSRRVFEKVIQGVGSALATLGQVSPVYGHITDGNHDGDLAFYVATALAAYFRETPHITVETSYNHQVSFIEGDTLHILDHGRNWSNLGTKAVGADAATIIDEMRELHDAAPRNTKIWVGDKHSPAVAWPKRKTEITRLPALASLDDYAQGQNYSHDFDAYVYALTPKGTIGNIGRLYE